MNKSHAVRQQFPPIVTKIYNRKQAHLESNHISECTNKNLQLREWWEMEFAVRIFQFVNINKNLTNISLVCKQWHKYSTNTILWKSLNIDTNMIRNINKFNTSLTRWKNIQHLHIYIGLDVNPCDALNVLQKLENECT
eukprot:146528_1